MHIPVQPASSDTRSQRNETIQKYTRNGGEDVSMGLSNCEYQRTLLIVTAPNTKKAENRCIKRSFKTRAISQSHRSTNGGIGDSYNITRWQPISDGLSDYTGIWKRHS